MIGEQIHNYKITAHLGQGGMGNVYRATDTMLGREVALKMLHPQLTMQPQFLERFKKEARVLAQLLHPNIAVIYNFIEQGGNHFMVMEYVEGTNLDDLLKQHQSLPAEFVVPVFVQALEGLQHAHRKNIFHRDIKPSNIMLTPDGVVKLMDFGIAKVAGEQKMTQVNKIVGTVEFMAPELIQGKDASNASDIYATGVTMYELLSGKLPFESDTDFNLMQAILKERVKSPEKWNAAIPRPLGDIIMKALEKNPASRYEDARAFQRTLTNAFPQYRDVQLEALNKPASAYAGAATRLSNDMLTAEAVRTGGTGMKDPAGMLAGIVEHIRANRKGYFLAAAILIFLFFVLGIVFDRKEAGNEVLAGKDTAVTRNPSGDGLGGTTTAGPNVIQPVATGEQIPVGQEKQVDKPVNEKTREKKTDVVGKDPVQPKPEEKKTEPPPAPVEKKEEKKDVFIKSKVEVELTLRTDLGNAEERKDIPVSFSVNYPVIYEGVTIVRQGATATGTIKLGRVLTDIDINSVTAANGQQIKIKAAKAHGKRSEIASEKSYTAIILPGTKISF